MVPWRNDKMVDRWWTTPRYFFDSQSPAGRRCWILSTTTGTKNFVPWEKWVRTRCHKRCEISGWFCACSATTGRSRQWGRCSRSPRLQSRCSSAWMTSGVTHYHSFGSHDSDRRRGRTTRFRNRPCTCRSTRQAGWQTWLSLNQESRFIIQLSGLLNIKCIYLVGFLLLRILYIQQIFDIVKVDLTSPSLTIDLCGLDPRMTGLPLPKCWSLKIILNINCRQSSHWIGPLLHNVET